MHVHTWDGRKKNSVCQAASIIISVFSLLIDTHSEFKYDFEHAPLRDHLVLALGK